MKWVFFLLFVTHRNLISSQPLTNDDVRVPRQLNFDECCPCPTANRVKDNNVLDTNNVRSECPCRTADSETASSIFTPTLRTAQSFVRPFESRDEPKPLLNPEVGLASSVLETLREVTDQEYEEALARDVARSALQAMDSIAEDMPVSASFNVLNDILSPKNKEAIDVIPEASHNEETCVLPTLSRINEFGQFEIQPHRKLNKDFLLSKPPALQNNIFDMDNSPSDKQENILPSNNKFLDNIKFKTNILKSKLFPNNKGILQKRVTDESFDRIFNNKPKKKIPSWKFVAPLDNLKSSKLFDSNSPSADAEKNKDFTLLSNKILINNVPNNKKAVITSPFKPQRNNEFVTDEILSSEPINFPVYQEVQRLKNTKDYNIDSKADTSIIDPVLSQNDDCNLKKENMLQLETATEKNYDTIVNDVNTSNFPTFIPLHNGTEILDTIPSPSEAIADKNQLLNPMDSSAHEDSIENLSVINITPKPDDIIHNTYDSNNPSSIAKPTDVQDNTNNLSIEEHLEEADKYIPETACTTENTKSEISSFYSVSTPLPMTIDTDVLNLPIIQNEEENINFINPEGNNRKEESAQSINKILDKNEENDIKIFPNIKDDIIKTFENLKNINGKLQEKIKLKVQDALQLTDIKNNIALKETYTQNPVFTPEIWVPHKSKAKTSNTNTLNSHELQKMSDSILTLSSINENTDPHTSSTVKEVFDSDGEQSKTSSCFTPAQMHNDNNKEIFRSSSESQKYFRNLNAGMINRDIGNKSRSEIPLQKSSLNSKEPSSVRFEENEMAAQASEPQRNTKNVLDNTRFLKQVVSQPNRELDEFDRSPLNVNNFFDNVKSTISNAFSQTSENIFRQTENSEYKKDNNYKINKQNRASVLEKPKLRKSSNFFKTSEAVETDDNIAERIKTNLNPYKARVPVSESFYVNPILTLDETVDKSSRTLNNPRNILPKTYSTKTTIYNSNDNIRNENSRPLFRESVNNNPNSESTVLSPKIFKNTYRSPGSKNLGTLKDLTETALQNIHKSLGNPLRAVPSKENRRVLNNIGNENLLVTMANKRNELNEKLQAINLDFNDRLSSLSHKMADSILPTLNSQPLQRRITTKSRSDLKNKQDLDYLKRKKIPSDERRALPKSKINIQLKQANDNLSVSKPLKKTLVSDHLPDLKRTKLNENYMTRTSTLAKPTLKEADILKPKFKDNTIISATTSTRPKTLISGLKTPQTMKKDSILIPKISVPAEKKYYIPRLKSNEPHSLGSENIMSRVLLGKKTDTNKSAMDVSSDDTDPNFINNFNDDKASKQEVAKNLARSKLREAIKAKIINRDSIMKNYKNLKSNSNIDLDIISSASENVNREIEESLKQNVQYKCKMLCTKEK